MLDQGLNLGRAISELGKAIYYILSFNYIRTLLCCMDMFYTLSSMYIAAVDLM